MALWECVLQSILNCDSQITSLCVARIVMKILWPFGNDTCVQVYSSMLLCSKLQIQIIQN